jgi:starch-binding outer membrane protein, SusD/RagB family
MTTRHALVGLTITAVLAGCADLNEEIVTGVTDDYFKTAAGFEAAVHASYTGLRDFYGVEIGFTMTVFGTDEYTKGADGGNKYFNDYTAQLNATAGYVREAWREYYRAISATNAAIEAGANASVSESVRATRVAEARFLRAFYYFDLLRIYGDVPLLLEVLKQPTTEAAREPVAKVYDAIIADLEFAQANLPNVQNDYGRVTRPAAWHLLAKVYLTRAATGDLARAKEYADKVIDSGVHSLLPRFADVFDFKNERNPEVVWSVQYTPDPLTTGDGNRGHLYFLMVYDNLPGMQRDVQNGRPFRRFAPTPWLLALWDREKDTRYGASFHNVWYANNATTIPKDASGKPKFALGDTAVWLPGYEVTAEFRASRPYMIITPKEYNARLFPSLKKFHDGNRLTINDERGSRDFLIFRLAETYLMAAEALVRDGRAGEAVPYVNAVRRRAAKPGFEAAMEVTAAEMTLDFILDERSRELAGESMRWFDLVRTGKLMERVKKYNTDGAAGIKDFHVLRPIPDEQLDRTTSAFAQNPGY